MNYEVRRAPMAPVIRWRLEDGVLIEEARREKRHDLSRLTRVRIGPGAQPRGEKVLALNFGRKTVAVTSHSWSGRGWTDQSEIFEPFVRAVLAEAGRQAPDAKYLRIAGRLDGVYGGVLAILAVGVILAFAATFLTGHVGLGVDMTARMAFALILALIPLPWLNGLGRQTFDPAEPLL